jgi:peroxiredoxin
MKRVLVCFFCCLFSIGSSATGMMKLHGVVRNRLADSVNVRFANTSIVYMAQKYAAALDKDGCFVMDIEVEDDLTPLTISNGNQETVTYVQAGDDLEISVDARNFDSTLHYKGTGAEIANFMARFTLAGHSMARYAMAQQMSAGKEPKDFEAETKAREQSIDSFITVYGTGLPAAFLEYIRAEYHYARFVTMFMYKNIHYVAVTHKMSTGKDIPLSYYACIDDVPTELDDKYIHVASYRQYANNLLINRLLKIKAEHPDYFKEGTLTDTMYDQMYSVLPPRTAEFNIGSRIYQGMQNTPISETEQRLATYKQHFPGGKYVTVLEDRLGIERDMGPGKPELDLDIVTETGKSMKLSDLKGKVVYIDFWSRGCLGCVAAMKGAKEVREHFKGKDVAFVYVSMDADDAAWKDAIHKLDIGDAIHTHVANGYNSETVKKYHLTTMPSYYLIDKEGNFAKVPSVVSPDDSASLIRQIEGLLQ